MEDLETCSWCTAEVPDETLIEQPDGARLCEQCNATVEWLGGPRATAAAARVFG